MLSLQLENWSDLQIFLSVVRTGTMRAASQELGVSHSTISRRIDLLETEIGTKLFDRRGRTLSLLPPGEEFLDRVTAAEEQIRLGKREILGVDQKSEGVVRISLPSQFLFELLAQDFATFLKGYPKIKFDITCTSETVSLNENDVDVVLRTVPKGNLPDLDLFGKKVSIVEFAAYASKDYLSAHNTEKQAKTQTPFANWVGWHDDTRIAQWMKDSSLGHLTTYAKLESFSMHLAAAKAGLGVSILPCFIGDREPSLVTVLDKNEFPTKDLWVLYHRDLKGSARVNLVKDFLIQSISSK